jgi:hypothetical protein
VRARYAALCTELKPFPAAFPSPLRQRLLECRQRPRQHRPHPGPRRRLAIHRPPSAPTHKPNGPGLPGSAGSRRRARSAPHESPAPAHRPQTNTPPAPAPPFALARSPLRAAPATTSPQTPPRNFPDKQIISACFSVVLENPMGAEVFSTALGLANGAAPRATDAEGLKEIAAQPSTVLPPKPEPATVRALPVSGTISLTTPPPRP